MESPPVVALPWLTVNIVQFFPAVTNDFLFLCLGLRLTVPLVNDRREGMKEPTKGENERTERHTEVTWKRSVFLLLSHFVSLSLPFSRHFVPDHEAKTEGMRRVGRNGGAETESREEG